jgi:DNA-binding CsgD family transcriptional regulator
VILDLVVESLLAHLTDGDWLDLGRRAARLSASGETERGPLGPAWASLAVVNLSRAGAETECRRLLEALTGVLERLGPTAFRQAACVCRAGEAVWQLSAIEYARRYRRLALDLLAAGVADAPAGSTALALGRGALLEAGLAAFRTLGMTGWERRALRATGPLPDRLTAREAEVLSLLAGGRTNKEIAAALVLSPGTVERHVANFYRKIGAHRRAEATVYALDHGLVDSPVR